MSRPLAGIRVLDLTRLLPGPFATLALTDLGADVIKVEAPGAGDYMRNMPPAKAGQGGAFWAVNRDKRSIELNLKDAADRERLLALVPDADVVIESFRPGVIDRLGIGYDTLRAANPAIILCSISGYGQSGPYRLRAGHDINYMGLAGALAMSGPAGGAPSVPGVQVADLAGGALWAVTGILAALFGRERTGEGEHIDISMTEGAMALLAPHLGYADCPGPTPTRGTGILNGGWACYGVYETRDGRYMSVGALEPKFWVAFNAAIGRAGQPAEIGLGPERQAEIRAEIATIMLTRTRDEWVEVFADVDCCCEPVLELAELAAHPLHVERKMFFAQAVGDASVFAMRLPVGEPADERPAPRHGEHSDEIL